VFLHVIESQGIQHNKIMLKKREITGSIIKAALEVHNILG